MNQFLPYFIVIPLLSLVLSFLRTNKKESYIFWVSISGVGLQGIAILIFTCFWMANNFHSLFFKGLILYETNESQFSIDFFFDGATAVYGLVASSLTFLVIIFSRYYMHREEGYKRFFNNMLFFFFGLNFILFSGNFETLFVGWEILGVTSFFLIAFYRDRYLPVKNALKIVSLYRLADIALLLAIWICHHYFHKSITFLDLSHFEAGEKQFISTTLFQIIIPAIFLLAALIKSAQFPFSSWLPRAMEGPTTSSAIFYGSLYAHIGVFLMLRTYPLWSENLAFKIIVILFGLVTSVFATFTARVQSSVKTQIAYSSISQIGLMFIELALGLNWLALIHFTANAFLRCYQLLVSPSVLSYFIHDQFFNFIPPQHNITNSFWGKIRLTVYVLSIKEWNLDSFLYKSLWKPLKQIGNLFQFITAKTTIIFFLPLYVLGLYTVYNQNIVPQPAIAFMPTLFSLFALIMVLKSFTERKDARFAWWLIVLNQLFISLSIAFNEQFDFTQIHIYLSGILVSALVGYLCLVRLVKGKEPVDLDSFHGHSLGHPALAFVFVTACLGLAGFPITPTFIGEDLIIGHIHENQIWLTLSIALSFVLDGLAIFRIYSRLFLGPKSTINGMAYRSS